MKPLFSRRANNTSQLSYELPHRIHTAKVYPVRSPNGSTIIIYGHDTGLRVLWRGGRPLRQTQASKPQTNGMKNDAIMVIDSDDDYPPRPTVAIEEPGFESDEEELDDAAPYPPVIQTMDLALNTEVLHISTPRIPKFDFHSDDSIPLIFKERIVMAVSCSDCSIRVIALPLLPPSNARKAQQLSQHTSQHGDIETLVMGGLSGHQRVPRGVAITWTARSLADEAEEEAEEPQYQIIRRSVSPNKPRGQLRSRVQHWDLLVASHSEELTGVLHIYRIPLQLESRKSPLLPPQAYPSQTQYLSSPALSVSFSPTHYPNKRHSQLLVVGSKGITRIYDPLEPSRESRPMTELDSLSVSENLSDGVWLASFQSGFEAPKTEEIFSVYACHRKQILDAQWATNGRSIVALLTNGEWGIWDVDQSGPSPNHNLSFALRAFLSSSSSQSLSVTGVVGSKSRGSRSQLAPMTPNTRRVREEALFQGSGTPTSGAIRGGISVTSQQSSSGGAPEDSVIFWYGADVYHIPNLAQFWTRNATGNNSSRLNRVDGLNTHGELINCVTQFDNDYAPSNKNTPRDILAVAEHRLHIISHKSRFGLGMQLFDREKLADDQTRQADQQLLRRGELDLGGMDRLLDDMVGNTDAGNDVVMAGVGSFNEFGGTRKVVGFAT